MLAPHKVGSVGICDIEQVFLKGSSKLGERVLYSHIRREGILDTEKSADEWAASEGDVDRG